VANLLTLLGFVWTPQLTDGVLRGLFVILQKSMMSLSHDLDERCPLVRALRNNLPVVYASGVDMVAKTLLPTWGRPLGQFEMMMEVTRHEQVIF
jgi:hypothetical protein